MSHKRAPSVTGDLCFYCDALLPKRHEWDHFPIPQMYGGERVVPSCMNCHELKDRSMIEDWPIDYLVGRMFELPPAKIELAYALMGGHVLPLDIYADELLEDWWSIPTRARVVLAKVIRVAVGLAHGEADALIATLPEIPVRRAA